MRELRPSELWDAQPLFGYQAKTIHFGSRGISGLVAPSEIHDVEGNYTGTGIKVFASSAGRLIMEIDPGLGKSRIAIGLYLKLCPSDPVLVVCSKKALNTWRREFPKWTTAEQSDVIIIEGTPAQRKKLWAKPSQIKVITYQSGMRDGPQVEAFNPRMIIPDECKLLVNRKTQAFKFWSKVMHAVDYVCPMDGTLVRKGPQDLWTFFNIIKPKTYRSFWKFANAFCLIVDGGFGKEFCGAKNTKELGKLLKHTVVRLKDNDPETQGQRPPLTRDFKLIDMTPEQQRLYDALRDDMLAVTEGGEFVAAPSQLSLQVRHRQLLICPKILDESMGNGAAIDQLLLEMEDDPHIVVFTPYTKAIPFLSAAIQGAGGPEPYVLRGGADSNHVGMVENEFNSPVGRERATICSIGFAESFELWSAKSGHFIGYEWAQRYNYQAEKRLHRLITPHPINIWYYRYLNTVDDVILDVLNSNTRNVRITYQNYETAIRTGKLSNDDVGTTD